MRGWIVAAAAVSLMLVVPAHADATAVTTGLVRVNQVGYPDSGAKVAYLMSPRSAQGATAAVVDSGGHAVATIPIGAPIGKWNGHYRYVYRLDFSTFTADGQYRIVVAGPVSATSPTFSIATPAAIYAQARANAVSFYENQRDGASFIRSPLRTAAAHLNDKRAKTYLPPVTDRNGGFAGDLTALGTTIDASGGWFDAGDYLKFVETTSYTVAMMLTGAHEFPDALGTSSTTSNLTDEARFGLDWLAKMWDDSTLTLYYQVGIGSGNGQTLGDHDIWRLPQADDHFGGSDPQYRYIRNRPVFRAGAPGSLISPNLAGRLAADFALASIVFRTTDPAFAATSLRNAEDIFDLANTHPSGDLLTVTPHDFYPETSWHDDLELGATELARALQAGTPPAGLAHSDPSFYLSQAATWAHAYLTDGGDDHETLNLYDVSGLAHYDLSRALQAAPSTTGLAVTPAQLQDDMRAQLQGAVDQAAKDPFGNGVAWNGSDTVSHTAGISVMASEYDALSGGNTYATHAQGWLDNTLGADPWGVSFVVGDGTTFPHCMQHQVANLAGSLDGTAPVLAGAVVEGPTNATARGSLDNMRACPTTKADPYAVFNTRAKYKDNVESFTTNEPAIDLAANSFLAFAWRS